MIEIGYMLKQALVKQPWMSSLDVEKVCSVSECIRSNFCDFVEHWRHNGYWFFDSADIAFNLAKELSVDTTGMTVFFFEAFEQQYIEKTKCWESFSPEEDFDTDVQSPEKKHLLGFDVVSYSHQNMPECSPLTCNQLATKIQVNTHCLLDSLETAKSLLEEEKFEKTEPGPFRILAVYSLE